MIFIIESLYLYSQETKMKNQIHESNFVSRFIQKIRAGVSDNVMKQIMAKDPKVKDLIQRQRNLENRIADRLAKQEKEWRAKGWIK